MTRFPAVQALAQAPGSWGDEANQIAQSTPGAPTLHGLWRILGPALACWGLTAALIHRPGTAGIVAITAGISGLIVCVILVKGWGKEGRNRLLGVVLIACSAVTLLGARIEVLERARASDSIVRAAESMQQVNVQATIAGYPEAVEGFDGEQRAWVRATIDLVDGWAPAHPVPVMLWLPMPPPETWSAGTRVTLSGTLKQNAPESRAAYDISIREISEIQPPSGNLSSATGLRELPAGLRQTLRDSAAKLPGAELVPGLAAGDTSLVDQALEELMLESSLTHLVAVSGSNCALVIAVAVLVSGRLGAGRKVRIFVAAGALGAFVILVGPDASVQRAAVMAGVLLLSNFSGKSRRALPALGLAIMVLLVADPWQAIQAGFALSVVATAGILIGVSPLETWLRTHARLPRLLALPIAIATIAQFACAPLLLLLQPGLPIAGILANILAAPAAPIGTALGMATMLLLPIHSGMGEILLWLATWPARWIEASGMLSVSLPMGRWYWPGGWAGTLLLAVVEALIIAVWIMTSGGSRIRGPWQRARLRSERDRAVVRLVGGFAVGLLVAVVIVVPVAVRVGVPKDWVMVMCDVGQGDAILLRDTRDPGNVLLVDAGDDPVKLSACLDLFGVKQIELLVLTHDHRDHYGAMATVLGKTSRVLLAPPERAYEQVRPVASALEEAGVQFEVGMVGDFGALGGGGTAGGGRTAGGMDAGLRWQIIGPRVATSYGDANATCLVLYVEVAGVRILLLADTGEEEQLWLAQSYPWLTADAVKVAHHGSRDQAAGFYEQLGARVSLISVGENRYGHPNGALVDTIVRSGAAALRTDEQGSIAISVEDDGETGEKRLLPWAAGERSEVSGSLNVWGSG